MTPLRVLSVEDCEDDWLLLLRELERAGYEVVWARVQTAEAMRWEMAREWDVIISDFQLPGFNAMGALAIAASSGRDLPFIIASSTVGEEAAVSALKAGAHDFVLKGQLARFIPAVARALRDASERRERRRVEAELAASAVRYRRIVETAQEGIWMLDAEGCTTYVNRRMAELLKAPSEQLLGTRLSQFVADPDVILAEPPGGGSLRRHVEVEFLCFDGSRFWASVSAAPIVDDDNRRLGSLATVVDVTEQRRLTEQLMISDRMASVGTLAAGVAHEINNPLAVILSNVELATRRLADERSRGLVSTQVEPLDEELRDVREAARRVRDIVSDLRVFSRGDDDLKTGPVDLSEVIDSAVRLARNELRHKATLVKRLPPLPEVEANEGRLAQVFVNLLVNAAQAITKGHAETNQITVSGEVDEGWVTVEIGDTGSGMTPDILRRLFTPFFTTKPVGVGMGLGLAISHRIVTSMGGEISVSSTAGAGTHFRVKLPISRSPPLVREAKEPIVASLERKGGGSVLVVDDELTIGITMRRVLGSTHDVVHCPSARAALSRLAAGERYDVILCDLMMPEMTGAQFHASLVDVDPEQAARVFFLTGGAFTAEMQAFLAAAHNPVIEKPFDLDRIRTLVGEAVQRSRQGAPSELT